MPHYYLSEEYCIKFPIKTCVCVMAGKQAWFCRSLMTSAAGVEGFYKSPKLAYAERHSNSWHAVTQTPKHSASAGWSLAKGCTNIVMNKCCLWCTMTMENLKKSKVIQDNNINVHGCPQQMSTARTTTVCFFRAPHKDKSFYSCIANVTPTSVKITSLLVIAWATTPRIKIEPVLWLILFLIH